MFWEIMRGTEASKTKITNTRKIFWNAFAQRNYTEQKRNQQSFWQLCIGM